MNRYNAISFAGIFVLMGIAWLLSSDRRTVNWRLIAWGVGLQLLIALFLFRVPAGRDFFILINGAVGRVLESSRAGTEFVFGRLSLPPGATNALGEGSLSALPILAFQAFPTVIFVSALVSVLYYLRVMPVVIHGFACVFTKLMRVSGAESLCAASNIFVGVESALTIKPHLEKMTRSELCTVLTVGMATVASTVLGIYASFLTSTFPSIAGHLVSASLLSAPAALMISKLILPETEEPETLGISLSPHYEREGSLFEAIIKGANVGVKLMVGIIALLVAILGLVALVDLVLVGVGWRLNARFGWQAGWSLRELLGYVFRPLAYVIGVHPGDAKAVAELIGARLVATEVEGYLGLAALLREGRLVETRSAVVAAYALCGFAHLPSLAIFVGGTSALAPSRSGDLARVGIRALIAANLACLVTACVAGTFAGGSSVLFDAG